MNKKVHLVKYNNITTYLPGIDIDILRQFCIN